MKVNHGYIYLIIFLIFPLFAANNTWGFFGHRRINRLAVFTLRPEMMPLYKNSIEFLTDHAVDADKRRYAVKDEAPRHFIDLDRWYSNEGLNLPHRYEEALAYFTDFYRIENNDSSLLGKKNNIFINKKHYYELMEKPWHDTIAVDGLTRLFAQEVLPIARKSDKVILKGSLINRYLSHPMAHDSVEYVWRDTFSLHGILPYQLPLRYKELVKAFIKKDKRQILRLSADIGHYIGDAHVPLHTTSNYNGQFTNQIGLHAFWESRIPELFADSRYDYFVGNATYIKNVDEFVWNVVHESHSYVDSVLRVEKRLSLAYPGDQQYCFDDRLGVTVRTQCEAYALAYSEAMKGMVESRMRKAILAVGSLWYSAWVDAGQPNLATLLKSQEDLKDVQDVEIEKAYNKGDILGRPEN